MRSAVILAGGSSSRLGAEKSLLEFGDRPLLCRTVELLLQAADEVIVVARDADHASRLGELVSGAILAQDSVPGFGPVAGLDAGMRCARGRPVFATGCDLPFLNLLVIERLFDFFEQEEGCGAAVPVRSGYMEPLHAVYDRERMLSACEGALKKGERRIAAPLRHLRVMSISEELLRPLDPQLLTFFNLNTPQDLLEARRLWLEHSSPGAGF
jgi:molybdopterin-guanine dinucleotide biosynthesis protein A